MGMETNLHTRSAHGKHEFPYTSKQRLFRERAPKVFFFYSLSIFKALFKRVTDKKRPNAGVRIHTRHLGTGAHKNSTTRCAFTFHEKPVRRLHLHGALRCYRTVQLNRW